MSAKLVRVVEFANHEHYVYSCVDCGTEYIRSVKGKHINPYCADCSRKYQRIRANEQKAKRQEEHDKQIIKDFAEWLPKYFDLRFSNNPNVWIDEYFNHTSEKVLEQLKEQTNE